MTIVSHRIYESQDIFVRRVFSYRIEKELYEHSGFMWANGNRIIVSETPRCDVSTNSIIIFRTLVVLP